jgi:AraC-like DNA-binding protein
MTNNTPLSLRSEINTDWWYAFKEKFPPWAFETPEEVLGGSLIRQRFSAVYGNGYIAATAIDDGFMMLFWNFRVNEELVVQLPAVAYDDLQVMHFFQANKPIQINLRHIKDLDNQVVEEPSGIVLGVDRYAHSIQYATDTTVTHCMLVSSQQWLRWTISDSATLATIDAKIGKATIYRPLSAIYRPYLQQIEANTIDNKLGILRLKSDAYSLLATLLTSLTEEHPSMVISTNDISRADLQILMAIESRLITDLTVKPPTTTELAHEFGISNTKLKVLFQKLFGTGIYEYFQAHRMNEARNLILSRQMTVSQAGRYFSYKNLSNFSMAFKKQFGYLPREVVRPKPDIN